MPAPTIPAFVEVHHSHDKFKNPAANPDNWAIANGNWMDDSTWENGVPTATEKTVISGFSVTLNGSDCQVGHLYMQNFGKLIASHTVNTKLTHTTIAGDDTAELHIHGATENDPLPANITCRLVKRDVALPAPNDDALQHTGGILFVDHTKVRIYGAPKTTEANLLRLSVEPLAGHTTLTFEIAPTGWAVGDKVFIPPTSHYLNESFKGILGADTDYEEKTISAITGDVVTLDSPLARSHLGAADTKGILPKMLPHALNSTRNIIIESENPNGVRGHCLFAERCDVSIRYASFLNLGRTTGTWINSGTVDGDWNSVTYGSNQIGRYPIHFHHCYGPENPGNTGYQGKLIGCYIFEGKKWPIAIHGTSFFDIRANTVLRGQHSLVALEDGNEAENNFESNGTFCVYALGEDLAWPVSNHWWFIQPGRNRFKNNVMAGGVGSEYHPHGVHVDGLGRGGFPANMTGGQHPYPLHRGADVMHGTLGVDFEMVTLRHTNWSEFDGNEAYALAVGLAYDHYQHQVYTPGFQIEMSNFKTWNLFNHPIRTYGGNCNILLDGLKSWNHYQHGFALDSHDAKWTLKNADIRCIGGYLGQPAMGIVLNGGFGAFTDFVVEDSYIHSTYGFVPWFPSSAGATVVQASFERKITFRNVIMEKQGGNQYSRLVSMPVVYLGNATRIPAAKVRIFLYKHQGNPANNYKLFYDKQAAGIALPSESVDIPDHELFTKYGALSHGQTNAQAWASDSRAWGGEVMPAEAVAGDASDFDNAYLLSVAAEPEPPAESEIYVYDTFDNGSADAPIVSRVGFTGATWAYHPSYSSNTTANAIRMTGTGYVYGFPQSYGVKTIALASGEPEGTEYDIRIPFYHKTLGGDGTVGLVFRANPLADSFYRLIYATFSNRYELIKRVAGSEETLGQTANGYVASGALNNIEIRIRDSSPRIDVRINNVSVLTSDDMTDTGGTRIGLMTWGSGGSGPGEDKLIFNSIAMGSPEFLPPIYSVSGPDSGAPEFDSDPFVVSLFAGENPGSITITPSITGLSGTFTPTSVTLTNATRTGSFVFRPGSTPATGTIAFANNIGVPNNGDLSYVSSFGPPVRLSAWHSTFAKFSTYGAQPYVIDAPNPDGTGGAFLDGFDHYDPEFCYWQLEDYCIRKGLPYVFGPEKQAGRRRVRDRSMLAVGRPGIAYNGAGEPDTRETPGVQQYHRYIGGIARHYLETGDQKDIDACLLMASDSEYAPGSASYDLEEVHVGTQREMSFWLQAILDRASMGLGEHPGMNEAARTCLKLIELWTLPYADKPYGTWIKPFMGSLTARALITFWERYRSSADATKIEICALIPPAIKAFSDFLFSSYCWFPVGTTLGIEGGTWDKGAITYRDLDDADPKYVPITGNAVTAVIAPRKIIRGPASLSSVDGYYQRAVISIDGTGDNWLIRRYTGATREIEISNYYLFQRDITTADTFTIKPAAWVGDEGRGPAPDLNHMIFPIHAWAYWHTRRVGNNYEASKPFRSRAHTTFNGCTHSWGQAYMQKTYNQSALWTTDGLYWLERGDSEYTDVTAFALQAPGRGLTARAGSRTAPFRVSIAAGGRVPTAEVVTPGEDGAGTLSVPSPVLGTHLTRGGFTYTPAVGDVGSNVTITADSPGLNSSVASLSLAVIAAAPARDVTCKMFTLTGPRRGDLNVTPNADDLTARFRVTLGAGTVAGTIRFTPSDGPGASGTFIPAFVDLNNEERAKTFRYVPTSSGARVISVTDDGGLTDPPGVDFTTEAVTPGAAVSSYTVSGPTTGAVDTDSTAFTVTLGAGEVSNVPWRFVPILDPSHDGLGEFFPEYFDLTEKTRSATFVFRPYTAGVHSFTFPMSLSGPITSYTATGEAVEPPPAVSTYTLSGPSSGDVGASSGLFMITLGTGAVTGTIRFTPAASAGSGTFSPTFVDLTDGLRSGTFTYTPSTAGARTITAPDNGGLTDPAGVVYTANAVVSPVSTFTLSGPSSGNVGSPSSNFTVTLGAGSLSGTVRFTPSASAGSGTFNPTFIDLTNSTRSGTFTFTPSTTGARTINVADNGGLTDPAGVVYTANAVASPVSSYTLTGPATGLTDSPSSNFTVTLGGGTVSGTIRFIPASSAGSGVFTPSFLDLTDSVRSGTFTYTASTVGARTITAPDNAGLTDPAGVTYTASAPVASVANYTLTGPGGGFVNQTSSAFTITLGSGTVTGTIRFVPQASSGTGSFVPAFLDLTDSVRSGVFSYIPSSVGSRFISAPDNAGLTDPGAVQYTATTPEVAPPPVQEIYIAPDTVGFVLGRGGRTTWIIRY